MLHTKTLAPETLDLLKNCMGLPCLQDFTLVGGTALALHYGHRLSIDLDFFGNVDLSDDQLFTAELSSIGEAKLVSKSKVMLGYFVNNVKVDIVKYQYPLIKNEIKSDGIRLAQPEDIAAMKFAAITGRGKKKDFTDLYYLLKHFSIEEMTEFYNQKYPDGNIFIVMRSLAYFEDAEEDEDPVFLEDIEWDTIKSGVRLKLNKYLNNL